MTFIQGVDIGQHVEEFSVSPTGHKVNLDKFKPESVDDRTLYEIGEKIVTERSTGKPSKYEGWGGYSRIGKTWVRDLAKNTGEYVSRIVLGSGNSLVASRLYNVDWGSLREGTYLSTIHTPEHILTALELRARGQDRIKKIIDFDLSL